eukprot:796373-Prorocentrum_minimum.AAC.1
MESTKSRGGRTTSDQSGRGGVTTSDQSDAGSAGIFSRRTNHAEGGIPLQTNRTQEVRVYSHDRPIRPIGAYRRGRPWRALRAEGGVPLQTIRTQEVRVYSHDGPIRPRGAYRRGRPWRQSC